MFQLFKAFAIFYIVDPKLQASSNFLRKKKKSKTVIRLQSPIGKKSKIKFGSS